MGLIFYSFNPLELSSLHTLQAVSAPTLTDLKPWDFHNRSSMTKKNITYIHIHIYRYRYSKLYEKHNSGKCCFAAAGSVTRRKHNIIYNPERTQLLE